MQVPLLSWRGPLTDSYRLQNGLTAQKESRHHHPAQLTAAAIQQCGIQGHWVIKAKRCKSASLLSRKSCAEALTAGRNPFRHPALQILLSSPAAARWQRTAPTRGCWGPWGLWPPWAWSSGSAAGPLGQHRGPGAESTGDSASAGAADSGPTGGDGRSTHTHTHTQYKQQPRHTCRWVNHHQPRPDFGPREPRPPAGPRDSPARVWRRWWHRRCSPARPVLGSSALHRLGRYRLLQKTPYYIWPLSCSVCTCCIWVLMPHSV